MRNNTKFLGMLIILIFNSFLSFSQNVKGVILNELNNEPILDIEVQIQGTDFVEYTDIRGEFKFKKVPSGEYVLTCVKDGVVSTLTEFTVKTRSVNLGELKIKAAAGASNIVDFGLISLESDELVAENGQEQVSSVLTSGRDVFGNVAAFNFSAGRFRMRGYDSENNETLLNGVLMNDGDDGRTFWNSWGGLNDVFRVRTSELSLGFTPFTFGSIGGANNINMRASVQRAQTSASYAASNRSYRNRVMFTHSSGLNQNGWAYTISGSRRWAQEGYIDATYYDAFSYFASVQKVINSQHSLNLVAFGAPLDRGRSGGSVQEVYDLAGSNYYNPNWGYQNGEKRNARAYKSHMPIIMLTHDWVMNENTSLHTTILGQKGKYASTGLDWFLAADPRPDYYRKLPSALDSPELAAELTEFYQANPQNLQINWDNLYQINYGRNFTIDNANNSGESLTGALAAYVVQEQRFDVNKYALSSNLQHIFDDVSSIYGGLNLRREINENFKVLDDLLGADFYVDYDEFAIRDLPENPDAQQADLNNINRIITEGDVFGYKYDVTVDYADLWAQYLGSLKSVDFFIGAKVSSTSFWRTGYYKNGQFPDSSFGESEKTSFLNYNLKGGLTYKLNNRNYFYGNASYQTRAPFSRYAYTSPRTRDQLVPNLTNEKIMSGEIGYLARFPGFKGRATAYYTTFTDQLFSRSFYHDQERGFVNYIMNGVDKLHRGVELAGEYALTSTINIKAVAAVGDYTYNDRPIATISQDNDANVLVTDRTVYLKNYKVAGTPQSAFALGAEYRSPKFWSVSLTANYFDDIYIDVNPDRRTEAGVAGIEKELDPELWYSVLDQEKVDGQLTLDFFGSKSWRVKGNTLGLTVGVSNILNNTEFITGGYEQLRFDYEEKDVNRFPARYFYAYGVNYFVGLSLRI